MPHVTLVVVLKTVTLVLGGLITFFAFRAYRRTRARPLGALALGFGIITLGAFLAGVVDQLLQLGPSGAHTWALVVESTLTAIGFGIILYSLYAE